MKTWCLLITLSESFIYMTCIISSVYVVNVPFVHDLVILNVMSKPFCLMSYFLASIQLFFWPWTLGLSSAIRPLLRRMPEVLTYFNRHHQSSFPCVFSCSSFCLHVWQILGHHWQMGLLAPSSWRFRKKKPEAAQWEWAFLIRRDAASFPWAVGMCPHASHFSLSLFFSCFRSRSKCSVLAYFGEAQTILSKVPLQESKKTSGFILTFRFLAEQSRHRFFLWKITFTFSNLLHICLLDQEVNVDVHINR